MRELFRTLPLMCVILLVPVLPFLFFGGQVEDWLSDLREDPPSELVTACLVIGMLATDILLPIPSSVISTMSGWQLGWWQGTLTTWVGMNLGAVIGFALAKRWGTPMALWFSKPSDLKKLQKIYDRFGPLVLILTRAMPVFAEASVLLSGIHGLSWRRFLPAVVLSNFGIALGYAAFGEYAQRHQWLPLALGVSVAVPVLIAAVAGRWLPNDGSESDEAISETKKLTSCIKISRPNPRSICLFTLSILLSTWILASSASADEKPPQADYCERLEQDIQGRKHGFLAGNVTYYVGGFHASWKLIEDETVGLTHPFHHDLRSRGVGLLESELASTEHTGTGNDYLGWEFYKDTRVLYGSVVVNGKTYKNPEPKRMRWRPDKLICEYEVAGITIREEKFIASNDAAASIITASQPVTLRFSGQSFSHRNSVSSTATITVDPQANAIVISEGGTVKSRPDPGGRERVGPCVYDGMTTALSCSRSLVDSANVSRDERGVQHYSFSVPCDRDGTTVSWSMHDAPRIAIQKSRDVILNDQHWLASKTAEMNRQLNEEIPWFRCSDKRFVDIYYYLWALYLMYYIDVDKGWEQENHTQTAVNNFLGMHRYDAAFQIKVGAWTTDKPKLAYGNVLTWKHLTKNDRFRETRGGVRMLSDNKGTTWHSGAYGNETSEHVLGAWQIYQHTGDVPFLKACYEDHFAKLFWNGIPSFFMNSFEVADRLESMASLTNNESDVAHWQAAVRRDPEHIRRMFEQRWESNGVANYFMAPANGMIMTTGFWAMRSPHFPNSFAQPMVDTWALDREKGFFGEFFPLAMSKQSMDTHKTAVDHSFGYTPDTAYFTLDGMFRQGLAKVASKLTVNHLKGYNYHQQWQIPVAPEAYRRDLTLFGDQYSNFNAGKILLYLEGLAGLSISIPERQLSVRPALPESWEWMEIRLPIKNEWTKIRYTRDGVQVSDCPLRVSLP